MNTSFTRYTDGKLLTLAVSWEIDIAFMRDSNFKTMSDEICVWAQSIELSRNVSSLL